MSFTTPGRGLAAHPPHSPHHAQLLPSAGRAEVPQREISIFWDFENVHLPSSVSASDASKAIVQAVSHYGRIVDRRLYFDMSSTAASHNGWSALDSSGFDLVNTPRRNSKETLDKKLIADVLTFAWDSAVRNDNCKPCVVLLTSDGDYSYCINKLRDRGVLSVVMYGNDSTVASILKDAADVSLSFYNDVLPNISRGNSPTENDPAQTLCKVLVEQGDSWVLGGNLAIRFRNAVDVKKAPHNNIKEYYQRARDSALANGWMERGRRYLGTGPNRNDIVKETSYDSKAGLLSKEDFFRITKTGRSALTGNNNINNTKAAAEGSRQTRLFFKNVPKSLHITALVQYLEESHGVQVVKGYTFTNKIPKTSFIFACIEVTTENEAERLIEASGQSQMEVEGRNMMVEYNTSPKDVSVHPNHLYERPVDEMADGRAYTQAFAEYAQGHPQRVKDDGWFDAGFWNEIKGNRVPMGGDKDRIKQARSVAIQQGWIEGGRRDKVTGTIEVYDGRNTARHAPELYVRLTIQGKEEHGIDQSIILTKPPAENRNLFVRNVVAGTDVREFVRYLESEYDLAIEKASLEFSKSWDTCTNAHLQFIDAKDAKQMIDVVSENGILFKGRALKAVPDQNIPKFQADRDPAHYYVRPSVLDTTSSNASIVSGISSTKETATPSLAEGSTATNVTEHPAWVCRVLYDMQYSALAEKDLQSWRSTGTAADLFMKRACPNYSPDLRKVCWKNALHDVISEGLIEMGRRVLKSPSRSITLVPFFGERHDASLSKETYLRLTYKGKEFAETTTNLPVVEGMSDEVEKKNAFVTNLPLSTNIQELVQYLEATHGVQIDNALKTTYSTFAAAAHIEFINPADYKNLSCIALQDGLIFGGRQLRVRLDKSVPVWSQCDGENAQVLFRRSDPSEIETLDNTSALEDTPVRDNASPLLNNTNKMDDTLLLDDSCAVNLFPTKDQLFDENPPPLDLSSLGTSFVNTPTSFHELEHTPSTHKKTLPSDAYDGDTHGFDSSDHQVNAIVRNTMALVDDDGPSLSSALTPSWG